MEPQSYTPTADANDYYSGRVLANINDSDFTTGTQWQNLAGPVKLTLTFASAVVLTQIQTAGGYAQTGHQYKPGRIDVYRGDPDTDGVLLTSFAPDYVPTAYNFVNTVGDTVYTLVLTPQIGMSTLAVKEVVAVGDLGAGGGPGNISVGAMSSHLATSLMDHVFGKGTWPASWPGSNYLCLLTAAADDADDGSTLVEPVGNAYARVQILPANMAVAANGQSVNAADLTFPTASGGDWGDIIGLAVCDASSGGNLLWYGLLDTPQNVANGVTAVFAAGDLAFAFTEAAGLSDHFRGRLLNHCFGKTQITTPPSLYLALCSTAPTRTSTGSTIVEPTEGGYARLNIQAADWSAAVAGETQLANDKTFADATENWAAGSDLTHLALCDAVSGGNLVLWAPMFNPKSVDAGDAPTVSDLRFTTT